MSSNPCDAGCIASAYAHRLQRLFSTTRHALQVPALAKLEAELEGAWFKDLQKASCCMVDIPGGDHSAGFNVTLRAWNPVHLGLGLSQVAGVFGHDEIKAVASCSPISQNGSMESMEYGQWTLTGDQVGSRHSSQSNDCCRCLSEVTLLGIPTGSEQTTAACHSVWHLCTAAMQVALLNLEPCQTYSGAAKSQTRCSHS